MWRRSRELYIAALVVAALLTTYWGAEFFAFAVPGTSPSPELDNPNTFPLLDLEVYGNLFFAGVLVGLSVFTLLLATPARHTAVGKRAARGSSTRNATAL